MLRDYSGTSTGANRVDLCRSVALRGILGRAPEKIALARDALSPVFPYVTEGDGLYADGSFVQHTWVAYSGTYGQVMLDGLGRLFTLLAGSEWEVTDPGRQIVLDSVEHAYAPLIHDGLVMDTVNGRAISRVTSRATTCTSCAATTSTASRSSPPWRSSRAARAPPSANAGTRGSRAGSNGTRSPRSSRHRSSRSPTWPGCTRSPTRPSRPRPSPSGTGSSPPWTGPSTAAPLHRRPRHGQ